MLKRHLNRKTPCIELTTLHERYEELLKTKNHTTIDNSVGEIKNAIVSNGDNNMNIKIEINVNPVTNLNIGYLEPERMKELVEKLDCNSGKLNLLMSDYIKEIVCNKEHPENHSVKYIKKKPPTFNTLIEKDGETISVFKGLTDTCELLTDPILDQLKIKLKEFIKKYKRDDDYDYSFYEDTISQLKKELNKATVKKALNSVLQNDILNTIEMKLKLIKTKE
jgi:hypothetical protein